MNGNSVYFGVFLKKLTKTLKNLKNQKRVVYESYNI